MGDPSEEVRKYEKIEWRGVKKTNEGGGPRPGGPVRLNRGGPSQAKHHNKSPPTPRAPARSSRFTQVFGPGTFPLLFQGELPHWPRGEGGPVFSFNGRTRPNALFSPPCLPNSSSLNFSQTHVVV